MVLSQAASGSALPMDAFCISSLKTAPGSWREELGGGRIEPALTQLMLALVGTAPRNDACGASLEQGHPILLCRSGSPLCPCMRSSSSPLGDGQDGLPWGCRAAGELMCLPGTWKWGGEGHSSIWS